ncbi:hypothetical protein GGI26_004007 [Coemansia sp. RSA 1358]|nr:hypothetical protein GGI26_004007 [Coemansia sp. RSA 1358]
MADSNKGILRDVIDSIFEPGVNRGVLVVMNCAFFGLFAILVYLLVATNFNMHVCALSVLSALLFVAINWFIKEALSAANSASAQPPSQTKHRQSSAVKKKKL